MTGVLSPLRLLRALAVVAAALLAVVLGARVAGPLPDLVLPVVVAGALLGGPSNGALLGLGAGWVVDLMPPGSPVLGSAALLYAAAGLVAGAGRRDGPVPMSWVALVVLAAGAVPAAGRLVLGLAGLGAVDVSTTAVQWGLTVALSLVVVPLLIGAERALVRRHLG